MYQRNSKRSAPLARSEFRTVWRRLSVALLERFYKYGGLVSDYSFRCGRLNGPVPHAAEHTLGLSAVVDATACRMFHAFSIVACCVWHVGVENAYGVAACGSCMQRSNSFVAVRHRFLLGCKTQHATLELSIAQWSATTCSFAKKSNARSSATAASKGHCGLGYSRTWRIHV